MPGQQLYSYWEGNRSQLLATHILSSVAAVVPVPREFDFGLDLLCTLTRHEGGALYAGRSSGIQVKSASDPIVKYGGLNKQGAWKKYELDWLYGQDQPIILCIVDLKQWRIRLYSTVRMWYLPFKVQKPGEVQLIPDLEFESVAPGLSQNRYKEEPLEMTRDGGVAGNGASYRVPLGPPIVDIAVNDEESPEHRDLIRRCLNAWIELDYRNVRHFRMGIPYYEEWYSWETNVPPSPSTRIWHFWASETEKNIREIFDAIGPAIAALLNNFRAQKQGEKLKGGMSSVV